MKVLNNRNIHQQAGFTLIELVVVIVILGILAATAAPKFIDLQDDAQTSTLHAIKASMESAKTLVHSKSLIQGNQAVNGSATPTVTVNGQAVNLHFGYPRSNAASVSEWVDDLLDLGSGEFVVSQISNKIYVTVDTDGTGTAIAAVPTSCFVVYAEATGATNIPVPAVTDC